MFNTLTILQDPVLDDRLAAEGYVIVPFLDEQAVKQLSDSYFKHHKQTPEGLYATSHTHNLAFREQMNNYIAAAFAAPIARYFYQCQPLGGSFIAKTPGQKGVLYPHQDWNMVDETQFHSFNIWVPLVDTHPENGGIYILPKSHLHFSGTLRGPGITSVLSEVYDLAWQATTPLYIKAGEALIYDHRLVHASPVNQTKQIRLAAVFGIIPQAADMLYYYQNGPAIDVYQCNRDFFFKENPETGPGSLPKLGTVQNPIQPISTAAFAQIYPTAQETDTTKTENSLLIRLLKPLLAVLLVALAFFMTKNKLKWRQK